MTRRASAARWAIAHAIAVTGAFIWTLSVLHDNYTVSGLEYFFQIPVAFPWSFLPVRGWGHYEDAIILAIMGYLNSGLIYMFLNRKRASNDAP